MGVLQTVSGGKAAPLQSPHATASAMPITASSPQVPSSTEKFPCGGLRPVDYAAWLTVRGLGLFEQGR